MGTVSLLMNLIWWLCGGFVIALTYAFFGVLWCITIIGIPFGLQAFKLAKLALFPFGAKITDNPSSNAALGCVANILWIIFTGFWTAVEHLLVGLFLCVTIIGIPWGTRHFKLAKLAFVPFGKTIIIG